jgi:hypothetical protein
MLVSSNPFAKSHTGEDLAVDILPIAYADDVKGVCRGVEIIQNPKVADAKGTTAALVAFEEFARVGLFDQAVNRTDELREAGMVLATEFLQILGRARINNNSPVT